MMFRALAAMVLTSGAAWAEPIEGTALALGCDVEGCDLAFAGGLVTVSGAASEAMATLRVLGQIEAVDIKGELTFLGDITGTAELTAVSVRTGDPLAVLLRDMQGEWQRAEGAAPEGLSLNGVDWTEFSAGNEVLGSYVLTLGAFCGDGSEPGGVTLSRRLMGGDPEEVGCWVVEGPVGARMQLRGATAASGNEIWDRAAD